MSHLAHVEDAPAPAIPAPSESTTGLLRELVSHLREKRTELREDWARRITESGLLTAMTRASEISPAIIRVRCWTR